MQRQSTPSSWRGDTLPHKPHLWVETTQRLQSKLTRRELYFFFCPLFFADVETSVYLLLILNRHQLNPPPQKKKPIPTDKNLKPQFNVKLPLFPSACPLPFLSSSFSSSDCAVLCKKKRKERTTKIQQLGIKNCNLYAPTHVPASCSHTVHFSPALHPGKGAACAAMRFSSITAEPARAAHTSASPPISSCLSVSRKVLFAPRVWDARLSAPLSR